MRRPETGRGGGFGAGSARREAFDGSGKRENMKILFWRIGYTINTFD